MTADQSKTTRRLTPEQQRCEVCGYDVWGPIWLDSDPPPAGCVEWKAAVTDCKTAMAQAAIGANLIRLGVKLPGVTA